MRTCYWTEGMREPAELRASAALSWIDKYAESNPDVIFFYTVETTDIFDPEPDPDTMDEEARREWAKERFAEYIAKPCTTCEAGVDELCDTSSLWIHLSRLQAVSKNYLS